MSGLRICILGPAWPYRGGLAAYNERLCREFLAAGDDCYIETFRLQYPDFLFPGESQYSDEPPPPDLEIRRSVNSIWPLNWLLTGWRIARQKPDILIGRYWLPFMGPCFGTIFRRVRKNRHSRIICLLDNIVPHEKRPGDRLFTRYFVRSVDGFVAMSKSVLEELDQFDTSRPRAFSPHPIFDNFGDKLDKEQAREQLGLPPDVRLVLFFGFIRDYKGLDLLLKAFRDQEIKDEGLHLLIAGEYYTEPAPYQTAIEDLEHPERVHQHTRFIPDSEVNLYFSAADLVVQPYKSATQSGVTQIAYHFEKPMVVTDVGGLAEIVPDGKAGFVVPPEPKEIARAVVRFFRNPDRIDFDSRLKEEKQRFSWSALREKIIALAGLEP